MSGADIGRTIAEGLADILAMLEPLGPAGRAECLAMVAARTGGRIQTPQPRNSWDSHTHRIDACGITVEDPSLDHAVAQWMSSARRVAGAAQSLKAAEAIVADLPPSIEAGALDRACARVLADSADTTLRLRADTLRQMLVRAGMAA